MELKLSDNQQSRLWALEAEIGRVLLEAYLSGGKEPEAEPEPELCRGIDFDELCDVFVSEADDKENPFFDTEPPRPVMDDEAIERARRERALGLLCGRWETGGNRCGIAITRAGEHFVLTYLKRNGSPTDERYVLMFLDGDILYYGYQDRITLLALNTQNDTLMLSPGVDYTRQREEKK